MSTAVVGLLLEAALKKQDIFQTLCGIHFDTMSEEELDTVAEVYLFKAIEEIVELRKEQPSGLNRYSKNQPTIDRRKMLRELVDVHFFLMNFMLARKISFEELIICMQEVQDNNFDKLKLKLEQQKNELVS